MAALADRSARQRPRVVALDCEMVGTGPLGRKSVLARISIVGRRGKILLDCLVRPDEEVTDWRAAVTGIDSSSFEPTSVVASVSSALPPESTVPPAAPVRASDLRHGILSTSEALARTMALLDNVVVVGHDLRHDFKLLRRFEHRRVLLRDTAFCPLLRAGLDEGRTSGGLPSLRALAAAWLGDDSLHNGRWHDSVEDARACMLLYRIIAPLWEEYVRRKWGQVPVQAVESRGRRKKTRKTLRQSATRRHRSFRILRLRPPSRVPEGG